MKYVPRQITWGGCHGTLMIILGQQLLNFDASSISSWYDMHLNVYIDVCW